MALYFLDWDTNARAQTVTIVDSATNSVLDAKTLSNFAGGQYLTWNLKGSVRIIVAATGGGSAVASGISSGLAPRPPRPPPRRLPPANFIGLDTATQGTWTGAYGARGHLIANGSSSAPAYGTVGVTGRSTTPGPG